MLAHIRIVLVETSHPGNIGAVARAMKNMGLSQLVLVRPAQFPHADATARASGADDILANAQVVEDLDSALHDCQLVIGTSARDRSLKREILDVRHAAQEGAALAASGQAVAFVFGRERSGLTNDELDRCHAQLMIPTNPEYSSLNLAQAVQILTYECRLATGAGQGVSRAATADEELASGAQMQQLYTHMEQTLIELEFLDPDNPRLLMQRLKRLFNRARLDQNEVNILRGILAALDKKSRQA